MALPEVGSVEVDENGEHTGDGMSLELYEERKAAIEATVLAQPAFTEGEADPVALLAWIAADCERIAGKIHGWLTEDAEVAVDTEAGTGVIL
jgi:hypothetical protein